MTGFGQDQIARVAATSAAEDLAPVPGGRRRRLGQVVAGAERAAGTGDRDDPDPVVGGGVGDRVGQRVAQLGADRVELGRPVQGEPDAPRRRSRRRTGSSGGWASVRLRTSTTRASTAAVPSGPEITGLQSTSRIVGSSTSEAPRRDDRGDDRRPVDPGPAADAGEDAGAAQLVEHRRGVVGVDRREADRHVVERPRRGSRRARRGRSARTTGRAGRRGSARRPSSWRLDEEAAADRARRAAAGRAARGRGRGPRLRRRRPTRTAADVGLVGEPDRVELEDDRAADARGRAPRPRPASPTAIGRIDGQRRPRRAGRGSRARAGRAPTAPRDRPASARAARDRRVVAEQRPVGGQRRPRRRGRARAQRAASLARLPAGDRGDRR